MAKINVEYDTNTKELNISLDGQPIPDVNGISLYPSWDDPEEFRCSISMMKEDEETEIRTYTQLMASTSKGADKGEPSARFPDFSEIRSQPASQIQDDIIKYLER